VVAWVSADTYLQHGTGHGFGSFLTVHEGPHGFGINVALVPGHVITNEPGFCTQLPSILSLLILTSLS
jgi:Xaa-Pro aminopeptidase